MFDSVFYVSVCFTVVEKFYNVPALGPDKKHFIFYILNMCVYLSNYVLHMKYSVLSLL